MQPVTDSSGKKPVNAAADSLQKERVIATAPGVKKDTATIPAGSFKFILETTTRKARALARYNQLKGISIFKTYNNKAALETKDSLSFNIYTMVTCTAADTAHLKQLLNAWYYGNKKMKVKVDH